MSLFVDTCVWSLAFRRDGHTAEPEVRFLTDAIETGQSIYSTGLVLQELLQGFSGPKARVQILDRFFALPFLIPERQDHVNAAELRNRCRRTGVQIGTIDALFAQLCMQHDLMMLTTDHDFRKVAEHCKLKLWRV